MSAKVEAVPGGESSEQMLQPKARRQRALEIRHGERGQLEVTVSPETLRKRAFLTAVPEFLRNTAHEAEPSNH